MIIKDNKLIKKEHKSAIGDNKVIIDKYIIIFKNMDIDKNIVKYISNIIKKEECVIKKEECVERLLYNYDRNRDFSIIVDNYNITIQRLK